MTFTRERLSEVQHDLDVLLPLHKDEVCMFGEDIVLDPDWQKYYTFDKLNMLHILTWREHGELVGYYITVVYRHLHYDFLVADNDVLFVHPKYRGPDVIKFFRYVDFYLKDLGCKVAITTVKPTIDYRPLAEFLGYKLLEYKYFKRMDKWPEPQSE
jgi:hypothetical protein